MRRVAATDSIIWGAITTFGTGVLALLGKRHMRRAALVEQTPTTPAASLVAADIVEIKGRVVAAESILVAPLDGRQAVWTNVSIQQSEGSSTRSVLREVLAVPFLVDDGSGRTARVVPRAAEDAVDGTWEGEDRGPLERVLALLATRGIQDFDMEKLRWTERALFVGDPVYVLGHAKLGPAPPTSDGYRSVTSTQLVLEGTPDAPLTIAAMTEERFVAVLKRRGRAYFLAAKIVLILGLALSTAAFFMECDSSSGAD